MTLSAETVKDTLQQICIPGEMNSQRRIIGFRSTFHGFFPRNEGRTGVLERSLHPPQVEEPQPVVWLLQISLLLGFFPPLLNYLCMRFHPPVL